jgi:radical SAM superfamily enzyme YgiQ (UPF0313 family)
MVRASLITHGSSKSSKGNSWAGDGGTLSEIPNLIYRDNSKIISNKAKYLIDKETISSLSFCGLTYLYDHELYIKAVENKFGFPVFIGRGCVFNCHYCGGSNGAFRLHSNKLFKSNVLY